MTPPVSLTDALRQHPSPVGAAATPVRLLADANGGAMPPLREGDAVLWAVGPEGGFTDAEIASLRSAGFRAVSLGRLTLRFDTAAVAALALTAARRGEG